MIKDHFQVPRKTEKRNEKKIQGFDQKYTLIYLYLMGHTNSVNYQRHNIKAEGKKKKNDQANRSHYKFRNCIEISTFLVLRNKSL